MNRRRQGIRIAWLSLGAALLTWLFSVGSIYLVTGRQHVPRFLGRLYFQLFKILMFPAQLLDEVFRNYPVWDNMWVYSMCNGVIWGVGLHCLLLWIPKTPKRRHRR